MLQFERFARAAYLTGAAAVALVAAPALGQPTDQPAAEQSAPEPAAEAQAPAPEPAATEESGDIVVTARRREESLQDVPIAVTAYSGELLERQGAIDITDVGDTTPN